VPAQLAAFKRTRRGGWLSLTRGGTPGPLPSSANSAKEKEPGDGVIDTETDMDGVIETETDMDCVAVALAYVDGLRVSLADELCEFVTVGEGVRERVGETVDDSEALPEVVAEGLGNAVDDSVDDQEGCSVTVTDDVLVGLTDSDAVVLTLRDGLPVTGLVIAGVAAFVAFHVLETEGKAVGEVVAAAETLAVPVLETVGEAVGEVVAEVETLTEQVVDALGLGEGGSNTQESSFTTRILWLPVSTMYTWQPRRPTATPWG
jgi:hypothetical protein